MLGLSIATLLVLQPYLSGAVQPYRGAEQKTWETFTYGRFEVRMLASPAKGTASTFFTFWDGPNWSEKQWNEIDMEVIPSVTFNGFNKNLIYGNGNAKLMEEGINNGIDMTQWHTYVIEWKPTSVTWFVDGKMILSHGPGDEGVKYMNKSQHFMMNFWAPNFYPWNKDFTESTMPFYNKYDYVQISKYNKVTDSFDFYWKDDFTGSGIDSAKWQVSDGWGFDGNNCIFKYSNSWT